jgi:hypothetical protein
LKASNWKTAFRIEETDVVKEGILEEQDKLAPELLPEESELFPVEKTEIHEQQ